MRTSAPSLSTTREPGSEAAFTLIEVLLAISIGAIVLAAINVVFFGAIHLRERAADVVEMNLPNDRLVTVMKRDLRGIIYRSNSQLAGLMSSDTTAVGLTQPVALEIFTTTGALLEDSPFGDIQRIDYSLQDPTNRNQFTGRDLVRHITRNVLAPQPETPQGQVLASDVQQLKFSYYDGTNWADTWLSTLSNTPVAIKVHVVFTLPKLARSQNPPIDFVVPVVMSSLAETNSAQ